MAIRLSLFFLLLFQPLHASFDTKKGTRPLGIGGAFTGLANSVDAVYYNPAGLWLLSAPAGLVYYSAPFGLKDLQTVSGVGVYPMPWGTPAVHVESYGFDLYRETTLGATFSRSIGERLAWGATVNYYHLRIQDAGSASALGLDAGLLTRPHEKLSIGFFARNVNRPSIAGEKLPQIFSMGAAVAATSFLTIAVDAYKDVRFPVDVRVGTEYRFLDRFSLRAGMSSDPSRFSAGAGFEAGPAIFDYAFYTHPDLGVTHAFSVGFRIGKTPLRELIPGTRRRR